MKRKKFVKQLMALGLTRNRANFHAELCKWKGIPYAQHYEAMAPWLRANHAMQKVTISMRMATAKFRSSLGVLTAAADRLRESLAYGVDLSNGTDYTVEVKGHRALDGTGTEILIIDEMHIEPPTEKNEGVLLEITEETAGGVGRE